MKGAFWRSCLNALYTAVMRKMGKVIPVFDVFMAVIPIEIGCQKS